MTTTPTIWKSAFSPNPVAQTGTQSVPQTIGLANGNILVVWEDDTDATRPFTDIIGQLLSPEGVAIGTTFQVNSSIWAGDETGPKIVALPDGGFVMAYGGYFEAIGGFISVERFNSAGQAVFNNIINDDLGSLTDFWEITADSTGNYTVAFERLTDPPYVHSISYDFASNAMGPERTNVSPPTLAAIDTFANGHILTFSTLPGGALMTINDPDTGTRLRSRIFDGAEASNSTAEDVAVLTGGQFVLLYKYIGAFDVTSYVFRVGVAENGSIGPRVTIPSLGPLDGLHAVALQDGGFFVAWLETSSNTLYGQRFGAYGDAIGAHFQIATNAGSFSAGNLSLAADGRILAVFTDLSDEVAEVILDPRDTVIYGTAANEVITTQTTGTVISGEGGDDTILGQGGNDQIYGGAGFDTLHGGKGNDTFYLHDVTLSDEFDLVVENARGGIDTVHAGADGLDPNILYFYTLTANVENGVVDGAAGFDLIGNNLANRLTGNSATNFFFGLGGNDRLDGGLGADSLFGGDGNDVYVLDDTTGAPASSVYDTVVESAAAGVDTVLVNSNAPNPGYYTLPDNVENCTVVGLGTFNLSGNNLANRLTGSVAADALSGEAGRDILMGGGGNDKLYGGNGNDTLDGGNADDNLSGGSGNDQLLGGAGADRIKGGDGNDVFVFATLADSGVSDGLRDVLTYFTINPAAGAAFIDRISVSAIDAKAGTVGDQAFDFIGALAFNAEGQIRAIQSGAHTIVQFNTSGTSGAEMEVQLLYFTATALTASDFVL